MGKEHGVAMLWVMLTLWCLGHQICEASAVQKMSRPFINVDSERLLLGRLDSYGGGYGGYGGGGGGVGGDQGGGVGGRGGFGLVPGRGGGAGAGFGGGGGYGGGVGGVIVGGGGFGGGGYDPGDLKENLKILGTRKVNLGDAKLESKIRS